MTYKIDNNFDNWFYKILNFSKKGHFRSKFLEIHILS